jgi:peptidyl-prolyl cis-trans isomerase C
MFKTFATLSAFALAFPCFAQTSFEQLEIAKRGDAVVLGIDYSATLARARPGDRGLVVANAERMEQLTESILTNRQLTRQALELGIDKELETQREIQLATEQILARRAGEAYLRNAKRPSFETLAKEAYLVNKATYQQPAAVKVQHILIDNKQRSEEEAQALVKKIRSELNAANFTQLAKQYSEDPGVKQNEGNYVLTEKDRTTFDPAFFDAAFALKSKDDISEPTKSQFGYHLIKLLEKTPARAVPFEEVKDDIIADLSSKWEERTSDELLNKIRSEPLDVDADAIDRVRLQFKAPQVLKPELQQSSDASMQPAGNR